MIYTLTFNPAIDYTLFADKFNIGEINRSKSELIHFGGKGINVSLILKELGISSTALGFIAGFTGEAIKNGIACDEIKPDFIELENGNSRINIKIRSGVETDINANGPEISERDIEKLFKKLNTLNEGDYLILAGSIPSSLPQNIYEKILEHLNNKSINFVVDAEKNLLLNTLKYKPFLIKPNINELEDIFSVTITNKAEALNYAHKLSDLGARNVLVSMGGEGAVLLDENKNEHQTYAVGTVFKNSVGAGDSMVAGFIAGYIQKGDYSYALKLGAAAGGATACSDGLATKEEILNLL